MERICFLKTILAVWLAIVAWPCSTVDVNASEALNKKSLKVISWNVENLHNVPGDAFRGEIGTWRTKADLVAIRQIIEQGFDAIFLQEASNEISVRGIIGNNYIIIPTAEYIDKTDRGAPSVRLIYPFSAFSKSTKILTKLSYSLPGDSGSSRLTRDIQVIKVLAENRTITFIHLHAKSGCSKTIRSFTKDCRLLFKQFEMLTEIIEEMSHDSDMVLVVGDLNREILNPKLSAWRNEKAPWIKRVLPLQSCVLRASKEPIDFVLVIKEIPEITISEVPLEWGTVIALSNFKRISDHCPIAFTLDFASTAYEGNYVR